MGKKEEENYRPEEEKKNVQRKMAEQLAERVGTSADEIEKGVKEFIEKSSESLGGEQDKPPYRRPVWYDKFFSIIQERTIDRFSLEFIRLNIVQARSEAYKVRNGLRFLDLIDKKGYPTPKLDKLRVTGEKFKENLAKVISQAYSNLFKTVIVEKATAEAVVNFMIERYGYSRPLAEEATALFVYFCSRAGITISKELSDLKIRRRRRARARAKPARKREKVKAEVEYDETFATLKFDEFSFAVKKELSSIEFARKQVNSLLDYLEKKLIKERSISN